MSINVDPDLGEILGLLDYKIQKSTYTEEGLSEELGWEIGYFRRIFEDEKDLPLERLLQVLFHLDIHPADFWMEAYRREATRPAGYEEELRLELLRLLIENLDAFGDRPDLPPVRRPPMADSRLADIALFGQLTGKAIGATNDLATVALWLVGRIPAADRRMLFGLCERVGNFGAAVEAMPAFLAVVGTAERAAWAIEHQQRLLEERWQKVEDVAEDPNLNGILFLTDLEIRSARSENLGKLVELRERLARILKEEGRENGPES